MPEPEGPGGPLAPPIFDRSVNPISTGEGKLYPSITTGPPKVFYLPASLLPVKKHEDICDTSVTFFKMNLNQTKKAPRSCGQNDGPLKLF